MPNREKEYTKYRWESHLFVSYPMLCKKRPRPRSLVSLNFDNSLCRYTSI